MIETVIKDTHSIEEYKQVKATMEELAEQAYRKHSLLTTSWIHGNPVRARYNDVTGYLQVTYSDNTTYEYDSNLNPREVM